MNHLEHSIEALYDSSIKKLRRREEDIHNKTRVIIYKKENAILLSDLNELRIQNRFLLSKQITLKQQLEDNKLEIMRLKDEPIKDSKQNTLQL